LREAKRGAYDLLLLAEPRKASTRTDSTFRELVRRSPLPMLVVKGDRTTMRRILFCTAGGEPGKRDIIFGGRLARRAGAATTLLYVDTSATQPSFGVGGNRPASIAPRPARPWIANHLEEGALTLRNQGIHVDVKERAGVVVEEVLKEAKEGEHDLIVVGRHLEGMASRLGGADLSTEILNRAFCPVMIVTGDLGI
jgi:nucleotide-binding universal stress UspA family protein